MTTDTEYNHLIAMIEGGVELKSARPNCRRLIVINLPDEKDRTAYLSLFERARRFDMFRRMTKVKPIVAGSVVAWVMEHPFEPCHAGPGGTECEWCRSVMVVFGGLGGGGSGDAGC